MNKSIGVLCLLFLLLFQGCSGHLLTRKQLDGANPEFDLSAAKIKKWKDMSSLQLTVRGVRLFDPLKRAFRQWGIPHRVHGNSCVWLNKKGERILRVLVAFPKEVAGKASAQNPKGTVHRIDVFLAYKKELHPENHVFLEKEKILSEDWRIQKLGQKGILLRDHIKTQYIYQHRGFRWILYSATLPEGRKIGTVFSLMPSKRYRAIPLRQSARNLK